MRFHSLSPKQRREFMTDLGVNLTPISDHNLATLDNLSENVIGQVAFPLGIVKDLLVNGEKYLVPLATEESSVVAAANNGARIFLKNGGVQCFSDRSGIYGQLVLKVTPNFQLANFEATVPHLIDQTNLAFASLINHGGGLKEIASELRGSLLYIKVLVDPAEAMGANKTNAILEFLSQRLITMPEVEDKLFAILSNYPSQLTTAKVKLKFRSVGGEKVAQKIALLSQIGSMDVYRAVTNNKGIMNGIDGVLIATGNDFRAVEAATHCFASSSGQYRSLSKWQIAGQYLLGELQVPLAIGTVGGSISSRKDIQQSYQILGSKINTKRLAEIIASIGLANNLAALLAISTKGIQAGHMALQIRNVVANLDASDEERRQVLKKMTEKKLYGTTDALNFLKELRGKM